MPDLTCLYQINVQARSLGKMRRKGGGKGGKKLKKQNRHKQTKEDYKIYKNIINKMDFTMDMYLKLLNKHSLICNYYLNRDGSSTQ